MKIAILYICTGKYSIFWKEFYLSCEKNFLGDIEKEYYVFTDAAEIEFEKEYKNIHRIHQENLGWPDNTLARYAMFSRIKDQIKESDFCFFFNSNILFRKAITAEEFLPAREQDFVAAKHPGFYKTKPMKYPFETRKKSTAYVDKNKATTYVQGALNGGRAIPFIEMIETLKKNIATDRENGIIALWHDESHWNQFINHNIQRVKLLGPEYLYPENYGLQIEERIFSRDKSLYLGGHAQLRGTNEQYIVRLKGFIKKILRK